MQLLEHPQGLVRLALREQEPAERAARGGVIRIELERPLERLLVAVRGQLVGLGGHEGVEEALDLRRRQRPRELGRDAPVAERLDRRDALDAEHRLEALVAVDVHLGELDLAGARRRRPLEHRRELLAGPAPIGPEVDYHRQLARALEHALLEVGLVDVVDAGCSDQETSSLAFSITTGWSGVPAPPLAGSPSSPIASATSIPFTTLPSSA